MINEKGIEKLQQKLFIGYRMEIR